MSTVAEITIFPLDKGESLSPYVAKALKVIEESGLTYHIAPMGTTIEGDWESVMNTANRCMNVMKKESSRVYMVLKVDYRDQGTHRLESKVESLKREMNKNN